MTLFLVTLAWLAVNSAITLWIKPSLFHNSQFWLLQVCSVTSRYPVGGLALLCCVELSVSHVQRRECRGVFIIVKFVGVG